jgi:release factor glutamine methyltransferase
VKANGSPAQHPGNRLGRRSIRAVDAPPRLMELLQKTAAHLATKGLGNARREAEWIFAETLGISRLELYTQFERPLEPDEVARLRERVMHRAKRMPLAYVLGTQDFRGLRLRVGPDVLVPRPETEELVGHVMAALPAAGRVLDVGTGSGAIALALKHERPALTVEAVDVSPAALAVAQTNAALLGLDVACAVDDLARGRRGPFAAVVANLPYIAEAERGLCDPELHYEPAAALFAADHAAGPGLALIAALIADAPRLLAPDGLLWLEHGFRQGDGVRALAAQHGLACAVLRDGAGHERFARLGRA